MLSNLIEPRIQIEGKKKVFSNTALVALVLPLLGEQFFIMLVGIADTLMISYASEAAVSGVSLVSLFIAVFMFIFMALASGGAVVVSQYIGSKDRENSVLAASQLVTIGVLISIGFMFLVMIFYRQILSLLFGSVDNDVMEACLIYIRISAYSLPGLALYNVGGAIFRSMSKTKTTMYISIGANALNVVGNAIGIFVLNAGVAGVAWPSFIARTLSAMIIIGLCFRSSNQVFIRLKDIVRINKEMIRRILRIAVPSGIEGGIFQLTKIILGTITATFGTTQIAANGIAQSFWSLGALSGIAMGPAFVTVIGQMMGGRDIEAAKYYMNKLLRISYIVTSAWNLLLIVITPFFLNFYDISAQTKELIIILVIIHNVFQMLVFSITSPFANGLRATGDVKFAASVSVLSTVIIRVAFSIIFGLWMQWGVIGIAVAMVMDWSIRAIALMIRYRSGKWQAFEVI